MDDRQLIVTPSMEHRAKSNKAIGILEMEAYDFLNLTVKETVPTWIDNEAGDIHSVKQYNEWAKAGEIQVMPFLDVDRKTGKVVSHEGRHRAAALYKASAMSTMRVAIALRTNGYLDYYDEPNIDDYDNPARFKKVFLSTNDLPNSFIGQFKPSKVFVYKPDFKPFYTAAAPQIARLWETRTT